MRELLHADTRRSPELDLNQLLTLDARTGAAQSVASPQR
jgi:hypothetical protein